jgi:hypothetical protein
VRDILIYVAGPLSGVNETANCEAAMCAGARLLDAGVLAFVPHLTAFWDRTCPRTYEQWLAYDFGVLRRCDALVRLPGASPGADREVVRARELGIPVLYSVEAVLTWLRIPFESTGQ